MTARQHILAITLIPLCLLAAAAAYYRFIVQEDFIVQYEGACDPEIENCYVACEDDECTGVYYYSIVQKRAAEVFAQCGPDVTDCDEAMVCFPTDSVCEITYCDITEEDCVGPNTTQEAGGDTSEEGASIDEEIESL